jgi:hypothetical protein
MCRQIFLSEVISQLFNRKFIFCELVAPRDFYLQLILMWSRALILRLSKIPSGERQLALNLMLAEQDAGAKGFAK